MKSAATQYTPLFALLLGVFLSMRCGQRFDQLILLYLSFSERDKNTQIFCKLMQIVLILLR